MAEAIGFSVFKPHIVRTTGEMTLWLGTSITKDNVSQAVKEIIAFEKHLGEDDDS